MISLFIFLILFSFPSLQCFVVSISTSNNVHPLHALSILVGGRHSLSFLLQHKHFAKNTYISINWINSTRTPNNLSNFSLLVDVEVTFPGWVAGWLGGGLASWYEQDMQKITTHATQICRNLLMIAEISSKNSTKCLFQIQIRPLLCLK